MKKLFTILFFVMAGCLMLQAQVIVSPSSVTLGEAIAHTGADRKAGVDVYAGEDDDLWYIFVDLYPNRGWEHDCELHEIYKERSSNGVIMGYSSIVKTPPTDIELIPAIINSRPIGTPLKVKVPSMSNVNNDMNSKMYAIILSGGIEAVSNYERYWNDCSFIYQTLRNRYNIPKNNIYVVMSDGTDPEADMVSFSKGKISSPLDLDFDGEADIEYAATYQNVSNIFSELRGRMTSEDHLFMFVIDHGGTTGNNNSYICLWNGERLYDTQLASMIDMLPAGTVNIVLGQCYSGGFVDNITKDGCVISTASTGSEPSWACSNLLYDEFVFHWTSAIAGQDAFRELVNADIDDDGHITVDEAFLYAKENDTKNETPMYNSLPVSVGETLAFDKEPEVNTCDLIIRDNVEDTGREPNLTTDIHWDSPDIWVRNQNDSIEVHENPYYSLDHINVYVYVRITNRGTQKYHAGSKYLHVHWADASTAISDKAWTGHEEYNGDLTGYFMYPQPINVDIEPGESEVVVVPWMLPQSLRGTVDGNEHFCILTEITDNALISERSFDVFGNRTIAQKNLMIIKCTADEDAVGEVFVRNLKDTERSYTLEIRPRTVDDRELFTKSDVCMILSDEIKDAWQSGGSRYSGASYSPSVPNKINIDSYDAKVRGIKLAGEEFEKVTMQFAFHVFMIGPNNMPVLPVLKNEYTFDLIQKDEETGEIVGGETFVVRSPFSYGGVAVHPVSEDMGDHYTLRAICPEDITSVEWTDAEGNVIGNTLSVDVMPVADKTEYTVSVRKGGVMAKADISVDALQKIQYVSQNQSGDNMEVALKKVVANDDTYVEVKSVAGNCMPVIVKVEYGESKTDIDISGIDAGVAIVSLKYGDKYVDNTKIVKK